MDIVIVVILIILLIIDVAIAVVLYLQWKNLKTCEADESTACPSFYCSVADAEKCGNASFRFDSSGTKICQEYLLKSSASQLTGVTA